MLYSRCSLHDTKPAETAQRTARRHKKYFSFDMVQRAAALTDTRPISVRGLPKYITQKTGMKETCHE
jgi:hypothetical protein